MLFDTVELNDTAALSGHSRKRRKTVSVGDAEGDGKQHATMRIAAFGLLFPESDVPCSP